MDNRWKLIGSLIAAALIAAGGAFIGVATDLPPEKDIEDIRTVTWAVIAVTGAVAAGKDFLAYISGKRAGRKQ